MSGMMKRRSHRFLIRKDGRQDEVGVMTPQIRPASASSTSNLAGFSYCTIDDLFRRSIGAAVMYSSTGDIKGTAEKYRSAVAGRYFFS
jgi:hypothetical protein